MWLSTDRLNGITFRSIQSSVTFWLKWIKGNVKPDLIIGLLHAGTNAVRDDENSKLNRLPAANSVAETLKKSSGFDLVIAGHDHRLSPRYKEKHIRYIQQTPIIESGSKGEAFVDLKLRILKSKNKWRITRITHKIHRASQDKKIGTAYIQSLPDDYKTYLQEPLPYLITSTNKQQASVCLNHLNAQAQDGPGISGSMLPRLSLSRLPGLIGRKIRRMDLYKLFRYDNRTVTVLMSLRDIHLLSNPIPVSGRRRVSYNRVLFSHFKSHIPAQQQAWWLNSELFRKKYYVKISDYHYFGGGGIIPQIFSPGNQEVKMSKLVLRDRFFDFMQQGPKLPPACDFMIYKGQ